METSTYDIYCPQSRLQHEPHMLNFWFSSCIERQRTVRLNRFGSLESCRLCNVGKAYLHLYLRATEETDLFPTCQQILMERHLVTAGSVP